MTRDANARELIDLYNDRADEAGWGPLTPQECRRRAKESISDLDRVGWREAAKIIKAEEVR